MTERTQYKHISNDINPCPIVPPALFVKLKTHENNRSNKAMSPSTNKAAILRLLSNTTDLSTVREIVAPGATYVSLAFENPELKAIEPWCGTHENVGPEGIHKVSVEVNRAWEVEEFDVCLLLPYFR